MKKETTAAVIFGIFLGGIVAIFILIGGKDVREDKVITPKDTLKKTVISPTSTETPASFEILGPKDKVITDKNSISISGKAAKDSLIVIQSPIKDMVFKLEKNDFKVDFPLALGENSIKIMFYPKNQNQRSQEKDLKVYYFDSQL